MKKTGNYLYSSHKIFHHYLLARQRYAADPSKDNPAKRYLKIETQKIMGNTHYVKLPFGTDLFTPSETGLWAGLYTSIVPHISGSTLIYCETRQVHGRENIYHL